MRLRCWSVAERQKSEVYVRVDSTSGGAGPSFMYDDGQETSEGTCVFFLSSFSRSMGRDPLHIT